MLLPTPEPRRIRLASLGWSSAQRVAVAMAMQRGLLVFGGAGPELLPSCWIPGRYTLVDIAPEREVARWTANGSARPALLELMTTGSWRSIFPTESRSFLKGQCDEATHAVRAINVGHVQKLSLMRVTGDDERPSATTAPELPIPSLAPVVLDLELEPLTVEYSAPDDIPGPILPREVQPGTGAFDDGVCVPGALDGCARLCASGSYRSCHNLALTLGLRSLAAQSLLQMACDQRLGAACTALAFSYGYGDKYPAFRHALPALYEGGCAAGNAFACNQRAQLIAPTSFERAWKRALPFHERACRAGNTRACDWIAYELTKGGQHASVIEIYATNCRAGRVADCERWAEMVEQGRGTTRSPALAIDLHRFACRRSGFNSCELLLRRGIETGHPGFPLVEQPDGSDASR